MKTIILLCTSVCLSVILSFALFVWTVLSELNELN